MIEKQIDVPSSWQDAGKQLKGTVMVIGQSDSGKSTLSRFLYQQLCTIRERVAYLDGDPGQSTLGPPSTMTLAITAGDRDFPPEGPTWRRFVGSVSPRGHMLQVMIGAARLIQAAHRSGVQTILYDTTGLIDPSRGGINLKLAKVDLLRPDFVLALQRDRELDPLLMPLRRSRRVRVLEIPSSPAVERRQPEARRQHRAAKFAQYFSQANELRVEWPRYAVFPSLHFQPDQLIALEDADGYVLSLGLVQEIDRASRTVRILTPLSSTKGIDAIRLGDLTIDPQSFHDKRLPSGA